MSNEAVLTATRDPEQDRVISADYDLVHPDEEEGQGGLRSAGASNTTTPDIPSLSDDPGVYYINFTPQIAEQYRTQLVELQADIDDFRSWASYRAAKMIERKIASKELDQSNISKLSDYKAKAFNVIFGQKNDVLNVRQAANNYDKLEVRDTSFHANILKSALTGFSIGASQIAVLDKVIDSIVDSLKRSERYNLVKRQYFILVLTYTFDTTVRTLKAQMRTIAFSSTNETFDVAKNKSSSRYVKVEVSFSGFDYDFNRSKWLTRKVQLSGEIDAGKDIMSDDPNQDVPVSDD